MLVSYHKMATTGSDLCPGQAETGVHQSSNSLKAHESQC